MLIHSIRLDRFLSFGVSTEPTPLGPLNLVIGPNGSGKSNLLEAFELLRNAPGDLTRPIREGGGVREWIFKGTTGARVANLDVLVSFPGGQGTLRHDLAFMESGPFIQLAGETIGDPLPPYGSPPPLSHYVFGPGQAEVRIGGELKKVAPQQLNPGQSILSQRRDPDLYPEITHLADRYAAIRLYRDWGFGRSSPARRPHYTGMENLYLNSDGSNLGMILNRFQREPQVKTRVLDALRKLYDGIEDYGVQIEGGTVQVFVQERDRTIPAARLSDGTLRFLCLLAVLCHPTPPPLVCIEEPELGMHPDIIPTIADLLREASQRCQLVVTTHSDILVDCMHEEPENVIVAERHEQGTVLKRLNAEDLRPWLEKYRLGEFWTRGGIGGTRW